LGKKDKGLFFEPEYEYLAENITFKDVKSAKKGLAKLKEEFREAKTKKKKLRILHAVTVAYNRAKAVLKREDLKPKNKLKRRV